MPEHQFLTPRTRDPFQVQQAGEIGGHDVTRSGREDVRQPILAHAHRDGSERGAEGAAESAAFIRPAPLQHAKTLDPSKDGSGVTIRITVPQTVAGAVQAHAPVQPPERLFRVARVKKFAKLEHLRPPAPARVTSARRLRIPGCMPELDGTAGGQHDHRALSLHALVPAPRQSGSLAGRAAVGKGLSAAEDVRTHTDLVAEAFEDLHGGNARPRPKLIHEAGYEKGDRALHSPILPDPHPAVLRGLQKGRGAGLPSVIMPLSFTYSSLCLSQKVRNHGP